MAYQNLKIASGVTLVQETGVANFMRCNIWHVQGRDCDLIIDTGMGLDPLKSWVMQQTDKPIKAIVTHCHFDHAGALHEFDCRLGHRHEAAILAEPSRQNTVYTGDWQAIEIVDPRQHPDHNNKAYSIKPAPLTGYLDEGDVLDLGDRAFQVLHLPGHSPGSIGLWDVKTKTLFSGDAVYDGELLDNLYHSDRQVYRITLERLRALDADVFHAGHFPSFGKVRFDQLADEYLSGKNVITDVREWYDQCCAESADLYANQDWSHALADPKIL